MTNGYTVMMINLAFLHCIDAEDIAIRRTEPYPNSQEFPCPHQRVQYECTTLRSVASQTWTVPSGGDGLGFTGGSSVGRSSDDQFSATLISKMEDEDPDSDDFFFTSTLLIIDPVNGSELICSGTTAGGAVSQGNITVVLSGIPDPPTNVKYDGSVVIVSSVDLEWSRPSYTGYRGVSVMNYTVSSNGGTVVVSDDSEVVRYTSQSLIYGDVLVSAINSCGQESTPVLLNIPASEPPQLVKQSVEIHYNNVVIDWVVGPREPGVVYPGEEKVKVVLDPGNIACLNGIDNDARCAVIIKEGGVYRVKIAINNEVGQTNFIFQFVTGNATQETNNTLSESEGLGSGPVAGITAALTLLVSLPVGVVLGYCCGRVCCVRPGLDCCLSVRCGRRRNRQMEQRVVYEEPDVVRTGIALSDNEAYGINIQRR